MAKQKILIVEDEESLLKLESILLTSKGYDVRGVPDGKKALEAIDEEKPDLVLLDIMLPEIDGFEVCQRIKENPETKLWPGGRRSAPIGTLPSRSSRSWLLKPFSDF